jgi:hypothetical protein
VNPRGFALFLYYQIITSTLEPDILRVETMNKQELKQKLNKYNYRYKEQFEKITVNLDSTLEIEIDYSEENKVIITDKLRGYNMLTGVWSMSIRNSIIFNMIISFIYLFFFSYMRYFLHKPFIGFLFILMFIVGIGWVVLWTSYYHIKSENFKTLIQSWDK